MTDKDSRKYSKLVVDGVEQAPSRAMLRAGLMRLGHPVDEDKLSAGYQPLLSHYRDNIDHFSRVYPGVEGALDNLRRAGWKLGVCTNKPQALADILLSKLSLAAYFPVVLGADALAVRKPDPLHLTETIARLGGAAGRGDLDAPARAAL